MDFSRKDLNKILALRNFLIDSHKSCRDYKNNKNAIMREIEHVQVLEKSIKGIDDFLKKYVEFDKK